VVGNLSKILSGQPKTPTLWQKLSYFCWSGFPSLVLPESWAFLRAGSLHYVNHLYGAIELKATVIPKEVGKHTVQMDELWSFVDDKGNKQWVWLAMDTKTREVIGCHIGDRSSKSAQALWDSLPSIYRQCAKIYTDHWEAYAVVLPSKRHKSVGKESGLTSYIERLNNTLRQRISRLVRKTLSFSKKLENHKGAIWNFIHDYNHQIRLGMLKV
jgi:IS1 family transposase